MSVARKRRPPRAGDGAGPRTPAGAGDGRLRTQLLSGGARRAPAARLHLRAISHSLGFNDADAARCDFIIVNKYVYAALAGFDKKFVNIREPQRGDVVVFRYPLDLPSITSKRLVGLPGDHVSDDDRVTINGKRVLSKWSRPTMTGAICTCSSPSRSSALISTRRCSVRWGSFMSRPMRRRAAIASNSRGYFAAPSPDRIRIRVRGAGDRRDSAARAVPHDGRQS